MNYTKPEITSLVFANSVIQNSNPPAKDAGQMDQAGTLGKVTIPAYEGDE
jgi:hypothetical protein